MRAEKLIAASIRRQFQESAITSLRVDFLIQACLRRFTSIICGLGEGPIR